MIPREETSSANGIHTSVTFKKTFGETTVDAHMTVYDKLFIPPRLDGVFLELHSSELSTLKSSPKGYTVTGELVPFGHHQDASLDVTAITPL